MLCDILLASFVYQVFFDETEIRDDAGGIGEERGGGIQHRSPLSSDTVCQE